MSFNIAISGLNAAQTDLSTTANNIANASTLLLAFFVVMYSVSSLNTGKYRVMSEALMAAFRGEPQRDMPITVEVREGIPTTDLVTMPESESQAGAPPSPGRTTRGMSSQQTPDLSTLANRMAQAMAKLVMVDKVII